jgi:4-hydroxy-tetrahydrodipicolinate reductase
MINICLFGASGKMGKAVILAASNDDDVNVNNFIVREESNNLNKNVGELHFGDLNEYIFESYPNKDFDLIIDFATRDDIEKRIEIYKALKKPLIFCSSGLNKSQINEIKNLSDYFPVFIADNTSILMSLMKEAAIKTKKILQKRDYSLSVNEKHHKDKLDLPSGTALRLCEALSIDPERVDSVREGDNESYHEVVFSTDYGDKLQIKHSGNRNVYAVEVLNIAKWFYQKPKNLYYMQTLIEDLHE